MKVSKGQIIKAAMAAVIALVVAVIFMNSGENVESSHYFSGLIMRLFQLEGDAGYEQTELIIRKIAHLVEYAVLGIAVMAFLLKTKKTFYGMAMFFVLAVAVVDEHIQSFSGRNSATGDILLDFVGALMGFGIVLVIHHAVNKRKS